MARLQYTPDPTQGDKPLVLEPNEVFVFAANQLGHHGGGSARAALDQYNAVYGEIHRTGRCYGLVTLNFPTGTSEGQTAIKAPERITQEELEKEFKLFIKQTIIEKEKTFYLTKVGIGIAGWDIKDVIKALAKHYRPKRHKNIVLPKEFDIWTKVIPPMPGADNSVLDTDSIKEAERMLDDRSAQHKREVKQWWEKLNRQEKRKMWLKHGMQLNFYVQLPSAWLKENRKKYKKS